MQFPLKKLVSTSKYQAHFLKGKRVQKVNIKIKIFKIKLKILLMLANLNICNKFIVTLFL